MIKWAIIALLMWPAAARAEDWTRVSEDAEIYAALSDRILRYDALTFQSFGADGDTQYITEWTSDGRWAAQGGQYCSIWPPSDIWTCYDFELLGEQARFISEDGSVSVGTFEE